MSGRHLGFVFGLALIIFVILSFPLSLAAAWFLPSGQASGYALAEGTIWNGRLERVVIDGQPVGDLRLSLRFLSLLAGALTVDWELEKSPHSGHGRISMGIGSSREIRDMSIRARMSDLPTLVPLSGTLVLEIERIEFENGACRAASGTTRTDALARSGAIPGWTGPPLSGEVTCRDGTLVIALAGRRDQEFIAMTAELRPSLSFRVQLEIESADPSLSRALPVLGFESRNGRYILVQQGVIGAGDREAS